MNPLLALLNKYLVILFLTTLVSIFWGEISGLIIETGYTETYYVYMGFNIATSALVGFLLLQDANRLNLHYPIITALMGLVYPLLGVVVLALSYLSQEIWPNGAEQG